MFDLSVLTPLQSDQAVLAVLVPQHDAVIELGASDAPNPPVKITLQPDVFAEIGATDAPDPPKKIVLQPDAIAEVTGTELPNPPKK